jgi:hypothetical protein
MGLRSFYLPFLTRGRGSDAREDFGGYRYGREVRSSRNDSPAENKVVFATRGLPVSRISGERETMAACHRLSHQAQRATKKLASTQPPDPQRSTTAEVQTGQKRAQRAHCIKALRLVSVV